MADMPLFQSPPLFYEIIIIFHRIYRFFFS
jgi:hypothetical protein